MNVLEKEIRTRNPGRGLGGEGFRHRDIGCVRSQRDPTNDVIEFPRRPKPDYIEIAGARK